MRQQHRPIALVDSEARLSLIAICPKSPTPV
jgi:hypothetical protein